MKRVVLTLAGACMLALGAIPAPGRAPAPGAVDFEMGGPPAVASASGPYRSPVLRAPRRFDLVGMRWASHARPDIELRARKAGGRWTRWTHVPAEPNDAPDTNSRERSPRGFSAPVWTGDADFVQYRLSKRVPGLRLHFVSVPRMPRVHSARVRDGGAGAMPAIQPRSAWGDQDCQPRAKPDYGEVQAAFVHHTVSANDYTAAEVPAIILSICRFHRNSNGWNDIGYNFLVDKFGTIWEGRAGGIDQPVVGAQAQGYNAATTGIADIGTHQDVPATSIELDTFATLIRWKLPLHGAPTAGTVTLTSGGGSLNRYQAGQQVTLNRISGHRDGDNTDCPGNAMYAQLPDLRARVGDVTPAKARTLIDAAINPAAVVYPAQATLGGVVRQANGSPLAGVPLAVEAYGASGWRTTWQAKTGDDGSFNVRVGARASHVLRVQFAGDDGRLPSTSKPVQLNVVPELSIQRSASRRRVGQTVTLSGTIQPSKARLVLTVERRDGKLVKRGTLEIGARAGRFQRVYKLSSTGLFRFQVTFPGDKQNAAARSSAVYVRAAPGVSSAGGVAPG